MNKQDTIISVLTEVVEEKQGCKLMELMAAPQIVHLYTEADVTANEINEAISYAVCKGLLVEVLYTLPNMDYREKSFLLPSGTYVSTNKFDIMK